MEQIKMRTIAQGLEVLARRRPAFYLRLLASLESVKSVKSVDREVAAA